jgi:hypothetical protein
VTSAAGFYYVRSYWKAEGERGIGRRKCLVSIEWWNTRVYIKKGCGTASILYIAIVFSQYLCYSESTQMAILVICKRYLFNFIHFGGSEYRVLFQSDERVTSEYRLGREPGAAQDVI